MKPVSSAGFLVALGAFWAWFAWTCAGEWRGDSDYSYGWIVLPMGAYFLAKRLSAAPRVPLAPPQERLAWLVVFTCAILVLPVEIGRQAPLYWRVFTWAAFGATAAATLAMAALRGGGPWLRAAWLPVIFLGTAVPWPTMIEQPLTTGLARALSALVGELLPVLGIPARVEGSVIALPACTVGIAEACSGVRSLQSALMVSLAAGELLALGAGRRVWLIGIGFALALAANLGRTLALCLAGAQGGEARLHAVHDPVGWLALGVLVGGIFLAGHFLRTPPVLRETGGGDFVDAPPSRWWLAVPVLVAAGVALGQGWYLFHEALRGSRAEAPLLAVRQSVEALPVSEDVLRVLRPTRGSYARLRRADAVPAFGYHFFWGDSQSNAEALYHRPDVCMPGIGWKLAGDAETAPGSVGGEPVTWVALPYEKDGVHALMLWAAWLDGAPIKFSLHTGSSVQQNTLMRLIANGRRKFSYEVAAVMLPYDGKTPPVSEAVAAASAMFDRAGDAAP